MYDRSTQVDRNTDSINFGIGQPDFALLPHALMRQVAAARFAEGDTELLNYGFPQGDGRFRWALAAFLSRGYGTDVQPQQLMITAGASQALNLICTLFTRPGDTVFVEEPSYFLALRILQEDHRLNAVPIPTDEDGLALPALAEALTRHRPVFLYTIPTYQNPTGRTLSHSRRQELLALAVEHDFLIVADEVYHLLDYATPPPPPFAAYVDSGKVLSLGSFSKILAPGLRLGWVQTTPQRARRFAASGLVDSGGGLNQFTSNLVRVALEGDGQRDYLNGLRRAYQQRVEAMDAALRQHIGDRAAWSVPGGGFFFWLTCAEQNLPASKRPADGVGSGQIDTTALLQTAASAKVGFLPGSRCSSVGGLGNCLRLCFAHYDIAEIEEGIRRLGHVFDSVQ